MSTWSSRVEEVVRKSGGGNELAMQVEALVSEAQADARDHLVALLNVLLEQHLPLGRLTSVVEDARTLYERAAGKLGDGVDDHLAELADHLLGEELGGIAKTDRRSAS